MMQKIFETLVLALLVLPHALAEQKPLSGDECTHPAYKVHVFSKDPLVIYISNFLTSQERKHLQENTKDTFAKSAVADESGDEDQRETRTPESTSIVRDPIVRCIESRALDFQGFDTPRSHLEPLQLVRYGVGESYHLHPDWFEALSSSAAPGVGGNRVSSFYVDVAAENLTGGGTNFPILNAPSDEKWCEFVDCDEPWDNGVTFRPVPGNAIFWQNLQEDGSGDPATVHAGLPVMSGSKIGMNIWTRQGPLI
ncbi:2OG-Fe(II) oxygenase superfamily protein [Marssonina coronariae]|uniref:2OG-Fe(II) oxygenase superfamily protein n=1 Tax=Diplocarpon coronariae TaxID=2795749 RepID=A0A218ZBX1_9HELO|nr:2OG-Fe(II) oxygenase superfamily protein [Marssonina coronariae]